MVLRRIDDAAHREHPGMLNRFLHYLHDLRHKPIYEINTSAELGELDCMLSQKTHARHNHTAYVVLHDRPVEIAHGVHGSAPAFAYISLPGSNIGCQWKGDFGEYESLLKELGSQGHKKITIPTIVLEHSNDPAIGVIEFIRFASSTHPSDKELEEIVEQIEQSV